MSIINEHFQPDPAKLLQYLGLNNLPEEDKEEVVTELTNHFTEIITETMLQNLSDDQAQRLDSVLDLASPEREEKISDIASAIPGLRIKIDQAITDELGIIKNAYEQIQ